MNAPGRTRRIVGLVVHILVGGLMIFAGSGKVLGSPPKEVLDALAKYGLRDRMTLIGGGELVTAVLLLIPVTESLGVLLASGFWGGVICLHMAHGESIVLGSVMLVLTWVGAFLREPSTFASFFRRTPAAKD